MKEFSSPVVVIDDDVEHLAFVTTLLTRAGQSCLGFTSARDALAYLGKNPANLVITDIFMPDMDGFELLLALRTKFPDLPVITLSGEGRMTKDFYLECARHLGAAAALRKPFEPDALRTVVAECIGSPDPKAAVLKLDKKGANEN